MTREDLKNYRSLVEECEELRLAKMANDRALTEVFPENLRGLYERRRQVYDERFAALSAERERIESAVASLPSRERRAITLHFFEGLTWEEVAEKMFFSVDNVRTKICNRAFRVLQNF